MLAPEYVAGLFDGEGMVSATFTNIRRRSSDPSKTIQGTRLAIGISNTYKPIIDTLKEQFGGNVTANNRNGPIHHKIVYSWLITNLEKRKEFLSYILPHVIIRRQAIELAIQYVNTIVKPGHKLTQEQWDIRHHVVNTLKLINRSGFTRGEPRIMPEKVRTPSSSHWSKL